MPSLGKPDLCILGEICLEVHGVLSGDLPNHDAMKNVALVAKLEVHLGGCGLFGAIAAKSIGASIQLIAHAGSAFPFSELHPSNAHLLDEILGSATGTKLVTDGASGIFFSFWQHSSEARVLYGKPGRGLIEADLEGITIDSARVILLSQSDPQIYAMIRRLALESDTAVVCAPNRALEDDERTFRDYLAWGKALVVSRAEAERYFGSHPEYELTKPDRNRKAIVIITAADHDINIIFPDGTYRAVRLPRKANTALLGAGDSFTTALAYFLDHESSPVDAVMNSAAVALNVQDQFRPEILDDVSD